MEPVTDADQQPLLVTDHALRDRVYVILCDAVSVLLDHVASTNEGGQPLARKDTTAERKESVY